MQRELALDMGQQAGGLGEKGAGLRSSGALKAQRHVGAHRLPTPFLRRGAGGAQAGGQGQGSAGRQRQEAAAFHHAAASFPLLRGPTKIGHSATT